MGKISLDVRKLVILKFQEGWSQRKISKDLNISRHGVQRIIVKFKVQHTLLDLHRSGRPRKISDRSERILVRHSKLYPKKTARELSMNWEPMDRVSLTTVMHTKIF